MRLDLRAPRQDAEQRGVHAGQAVDRRHRIRHRRCVRRDLMAVDLQDERPPRPARHVEIARMDFVQRRNLFMVAEQVVEIGLDLVVNLREFRQDREGLQRLLAGQRQLRHVAQDPVGEPEGQLLQRLLGDPDVLGEIEATLLSNALRFIHRRHWGAILTASIFCTKRAHSAKSILRVVAFLGQT